MEPLAVLLLTVALLAVLGILSNALGVDSRDPIGDDHARPVTS